MDVFRTIRRLEQRQCHLPVRAHLLCAVLFYGVFCIRIASSPRTTLESSVLHGQHHTLQYNCIVTLSEYTTKPRHVASSPSCKPTSCQQCLSQLKEVLFSSAWYFSKLLDVLQLCTAHIYPVYGLSRHFKLLTS